MRKENLSTSIIIFPIINVIPQLKKKSSLSNRDQYLIEGDSNFPHPHECCLQERAQIKFKINKTDMDRFQDCFKA